MQFHEVMAGCPARTGLACASCEWSDKPGEDGARKPPRSSLELNFSAPGFGFGDLPFIVDETGQLFLELHGQCHDPMKRQCGAHCGICFAPPEAR